MVKRERKVSGSSHLCRGQRPETYLTSKWSICKCRKKTEWRERRKRELARQIATGVQNRLKYLNGNGPNDSENLSLTQPTQNTHTHRHAHGQEKEGYSTANRANLLNMKPKREERKNHKDTEPVLSSGELGNVSAICLSANGRPKKSHSTDDSDLSVINGSF